MLASLLWTGREYYSLEHCLVSLSDAGAEVDSVIIGSFQENIYRVEYRVCTNTRWGTLQFELKSWHNNKTDNLKLEGDGNGNWKLNGRPNLQFAGCEDVDLPLTPFTNSLPINRLQLDPGEDKQVKVIYVDLLEGEIKAVHQKYKRLSATEYHYENVPNDFEADIRVDHYGFVVDYPSLFVRTTAILTK